MSNQEEVARGPYHLATEFQTKIEGGITLCGEVIKWPRVVASELPATRKVWVDRLPVVGLSTVCHTCDVKAGWAPTR